jgi:hypothetical protein
MLTKKDFVTLAETLRALKPTRKRFIPGIEIDSATTQWHDTINDLCRWCRTQNPRFNETRFRIYIVIAGECGPSGGTFKQKKGA